MKLVIHGAQDLSDVPGLEDYAGEFELAFAADAAALEAALPGAEILLGWNFRGRELADAWHSADALRWIHWCGAGVDAVLFPGLVESDVVLTNSRGVFDRAMAEYVLGLILAQAKEFPATLDFQEKREWGYRLTERVQGRRILLVGVGSIAREIAKLLQALDIEVRGVGRTARDGVPVFGAVVGIDTLLEEAARADWVIGVLPETEHTFSVFGANFFATMKSSARFINIGRGSAVDEGALAAALTGKTIAGAALDVFRTEPLPAEDPLWNAPNLIVSPHMSGDYRGYLDDVFALFISNLSNYLEGAPLSNVIDKRAGYVRD